MWHRTTFPVIVAERKMADFQPYYCMLITITLRDYDRAQLARTTSCHKLYYKARIMTHSNNIILNIQRIVASILKCKALNSSKFIPEYKGRYIATRQPSHKSSHAMSHRIFGNVEERESEVRERGCCFPPHKLNFRTMRQLDHYCTLLENRPKIQTKRTTCCLNRY